MVRQVARMSTGTTLWHAEKQRLKRAAERAEALERLPKIVETSDEKVRKWLGIAVDATIIREEVKENVAKEVEIKEEKDLEWLVRVKIDEIDINEEATENVPVSKAQKIPKVAAKKTRKPRCTQTARIRTGPSPIPKKPTPEEYYFKKTRSIRK